MWVNCEVALWPWTREEGFWNFVFVRFWLLGVRRGMEKNKLVLLFSWVCFLQREEY